jgi:hypothetical protein
MDDTPTILGIVLALATGQGLSPTATLIRRAAIILMAQNILWWHRHWLAIELDAATRRRGRRWRDGTDACD